jgi:hypothetical protein
MCSVAAFLVSVDSSASVLHNFPPRRISALRRGTFLPTALHPWPDIPAARSDPPAASPLPSYAHRQYRNLNLLSVAYALRPRLRSRLTPGGRTFPGKPRVFDGADSHRALATHSGILTTVSSACPSGHASPSRYAPLPSRTPYGFRGFGTRFSPVNLRRRPTRLVSCYALFE